MGLREICSHDNLYDSWCYVVEPEDGPVHRFYGKTIGCGCCSVVVPLTAGDLQDHMATLKEALAEAESALAEIERLGETV